MSLLLDTGVVYAYYDRSDRWHLRARAVVQREPDGLVLPAPAIPEIDHLLGARLGPKARSTFLTAIVDGHYLVVDLQAAGYARVAALAQRFEDLQLGFVDAAVVAIAQEMGLNRVATTDRRHFEPLAKAFRLELVP